eukprot:CAMPEP_0117675712 /NCGR_PEP_ID=MMETSP0804-20121206/15760_1 /TAXON_ID=1074897 /ORGANISM="Tetraselmis astigmatica, Strain CCMP880" /LENGTH=116 /DNA_ID=CAMNT_0005484751 /DNA_START=83 /DNA_END=434 /DNA_ORIENTATION=-
MSCGGPPVGERMPPGFMFPEGDASLQAEVAVAHFHSEGGGDACLLHLGLLEAARKVALAPAPWGPWAYPSSPCRPRECQALLGGAAQALHVAHQGKLVVERKGVAQGGVAGSPEDC